jgi:hypothetical protein
MPAGLRPNRELPRACANSDEPQGRTLMSMSKPSMLDELKSVLAPHTSQTESIDQFFNRQLHERIAGHRRDHPLPNVRLLQLSNTEVNILEEFWPTAQLKDFPSWHTRIKPARTDAPLIVFRGWGRLCLIDGQTRVNSWIDTGNNGPHRVLVIEPRDNITDPFTTRTTNR